MNRIKYNAIYDSVCMALTNIEEEEDGAIEDAYVALLGVATMLTTSELDEDDDNVVIITR